MFISELHEGHHYIPVEPVAADVRIEARAVPHRIRRQAYKLFEADRLRAKNSSRGYS
jgi:hypothetical protein